MPSADLVLAATRRDADTTAAADGGTHSLYSNPLGRLKVSAMPGSYEDAIGNITANGQTVFTPTDRASNVTVHIKGGVTAGAGGNFVFEGSLDSTNGMDGTWFGLQFGRTNANTIETGTGVLALAVNTGTAYAWEGSVNGYNWFRVRAAAFTSGIYVVRITRGAYATEPVPAIQPHGITGTVATSLTSTTLSAVTPGVAAANLGKAEDAVHASGDTGVGMLAVRNDNAATDLTSATGDYSFAAVDIKGAQFTRERSVAATKTIVASSVASVTVLAANAARRSASIRNSSTATLYLDETGATATSAAATVELAPGGYYELPYPASVNAITGIWSAANGQAVVVERV